jgi:hypothetical protein
VDKVGKIKFLISLLATIVIIFPYQALHAAKDKAGTKCVKLNATQIVNGSKYTCIKSGSKLVWSKGKSATKPQLQNSLPAAKPAPSLPAVTASPSAVAETAPNPFKLSPFPDEFTRDQMVEAVMASFDSYIKMNSSNQLFKLVIDAEYENYSKEITKLVSDSFLGLPFPSGYPQPILVIGRDKTLVEKSVTEHCANNSPSSCANDRRIGLNSAGVGWASVGTGPSTIIPHEIFHIWQGAAKKKVSDNNPDPRNSENSPVWFDEGSAEFFGAVMYSKVTGLYEGSKVPFKSYRLMDYATRDLDWGLPYTLGRLASEYIVASKGMAKFLDINFNIGRGQDFPSAFENSLGISLKEFYEKFDDNLFKMR